MLAPGHPPLPPVVMAEVSRRFGSLTAVDRVSLEIAEDVEIEVAKRAIASVVPPEDAAEHDDLEGVTVEEPEPFSEERARP